MIKKILYIFTCILVFVQFNLLQAQCWKDAFKISLYNSDALIESVTNGSIRSEAYKLLHEVGEHSLKDNLDELTSLSNYISNSGLSVSDLKSEINLAGNFSNWKILNQSFDGFEAIKSLPYSLKQKIHNLNWDSSTLNNFNTDIGSSSALLDKFVENEGLVDSWKKLDDLGADQALKRNPDVLDYVGNGRKNDINLDVEEVLGGHSKARHGSHLTDAEMEQRVLGNHPDFPQSRSALKFDSDAVHQDAVNKAFQQHKSSIESHFSSSDDYLTLEYDYGSKVGSGFTNTGTRNNPVSSPVESNKLIIALRRDATNPDGYILDSAYPFFN